MKKISILMAALLLAGPLAAASPDGQALMKKSDCLSCHAAKRKVVGPSFVDIAKKYKGKKDAVAALVKKVKAGGSGVWGAVPMAGHPSLSDADMKAMVEWILKQK